jgi:hypothetical protein
MNSNSLNAGASLGPLSYVLGSGVIPQFLLAVVLTALLYILLLSAEVIYINIVQVTSTRVDLIPITVTSNNSKEFEQNPAQPNHILLPHSDNEHTGVEFSYSFFLFVNNNNFSSQDDGFQHILHKGNRTPYPLMSPGIFMKNNINTMRVYVNSSTTWNNYVDIENMPIGKWVHIGVVARGNAVEIYINGNIAKKLNMQNGVIYQNFGNLYVFKTEKLRLDPVTVPSMKGEPFVVVGSMNGQMSRLIYFNYALSYTEIQSLIDEGPSAITDTRLMDQPPYLRDSWWVSNSGQY